MEKKFDIYQVITDKITAMLEEGIIPWKRPWSGVMQGAVSYTSRRPYSLLNQILLGEDGEYITFNECEKLGGKVKKGAKSQMVVFWKWLLTEKRDENGSVVLDENGEAEVKKIPILRYYNVFNIKDCEGIKPHENKVIENDPLEEGERVINAYVSRENLRFENDKPSNKAFYSPSGDYVVVPMIGQYKNVNEYYSTAFHELTHSTMAESRCNRMAENKLAAFGSADYSKEELIAELGSAFLMAHCGIDTQATTKNSAGYIQGWLRALKNDKKMIVFASSKAEYAANYILTGEKKVYAN